MSGGATPRCRQYLTKCAYNTFTGAQICLDTDTVLGEAVMSAGERSQSRIAPIISGSSLDPRWKAGDGEAEVDMEVDKDEVDKED